MISSSCDIIHLNTDVHYACNRSFAPIVLVLKVLMVQQGLDKPFTGGLGSYKLYVLVAHHVSCFSKLLICIFSYTLDGH